MDGKQLQTEVERLRGDLRRKDADLRLATSALLAIHNGAKLRDVVEVNVALEEQVQSLKKMVQLLQHGAEAAAVSPQRGNIDQNPHKAASDRGGELLELVLGEGTEDDPVHVRLKPPIATEADIKGLLSKLSTKEMQLEVLRKRCAGWEQQAREFFVIDLKFELQSLKDTTKENQEQERRTHEALVRREAEEDFCEGSTHTSDTEASSPSASPRADNIDLAYYKKLAFVRGKYWFRAEERANELKEMLSAATTAQLAAEREMAVVAEAKVKLEERVAHVNSLEANLREKEREVADQSTQLQLLQHKREEESLQYKIERRRSCRIMQELRGELNLQLMQLEKFYNQPKPTSPKPLLSAAPRLLARSTLQRSSSAGSSSKEKTFSPSVTKFHAAA